MMLGCKSSSFEDDYEIHEELGSGQFAVVRRCVQKSSGQEFAAKFIKKRRTASSRRGAPPEDIAREVQVLKQLHHKNVISLHDIYENTMEVILVLELVRGGELFDYISQRDQLSEDEAKAFIKQILCGLKHLHDKDIAHLDLKPENLMLLSPDSFQIKLIDFGLSKTISSESTIKELMGTPEFVAPEIVNYEPVSLATDMWSIGVISFILLSGASPFLGEDKQQTFANISAVDYSFDDDLFGDISDDAKDFISELLVYNQRKRASINKCLQHPWIVGTNVSDVSNEIQRNNISNINNGIQETNVSNMSNGIAKPLKLMHIIDRWKRAILLVRKLNNLQTLRKEKNRQPSPLKQCSSFLSFSSQSIDQDENFVVAALFCAVEEGNLAGLEELFSVSSIDVNQCNRHGESAIHLASGMGQLDMVKFLHVKGADVLQLDSHGDSTIYWAARQGHENVIKYLYQQGVSVNTQNKAGETPLHVASRYGHTNVVELLCQNGCNINQTDEHGETALHVAVWHGFLKVAEILCQNSCGPNLKNKEGETALHCAAARGQVDSVRCLLEASADPDLVDKHGCTPLHLALKRHHLSVAILLLHAGCNIDIVDNHGEAPIHIVSKEGLLPLAQTLCAFGCKVDVANKIGQFPLHLAAKNGHTEVVRCLCLAGCDVEQKNKDGIAAEITALAQGYTEMGDLLNRLRNVQMRDDYITELIPSSQPINRIKIKFFGQSGVGKSTFIESLKCGYFTSWFRRSKSASPLSPMVTRTRKGSDPLNKSSIELNISGDLPSLSFETSVETYTRGIEAQQVNISGVGDVSIWEFSGHRPYHMVYDNFIGNTNCLHIIVFNLTDPYEIQVQQVLFWLMFLQARIPPQEPLGHCGKSAKPPKVALLATHADVANCYRHSASGEYMSNEATYVLQLLTLLKFDHIFDLHDTVFVVDSHIVGSPAMKNLKQYLNAHKEKVTQGLPKSTAFLESVALQLPNWRKTMSHFPVISWKEFVDLVHSQVNPLAGEEHMKELIQQLQLMGEVIYLKSDVQDMVITNPSWLCTNVIGFLLSQENIEQSRVTGVYSVNDVQLLFPDADALDLLQVLESIHVCTQCENDGDVEFEFPCFNLVETLDGLWEASDERYIDGAYGGVSLHCPSNVKHVLPALFPRLQVILRRSSQEHADPENDLYQWFQGSKFCSGQLESLITLVDDGNALEVKVRGPTDMRSDCFYFLEDLISIIDQMFSDICPGLIVEKHHLSSKHLQQHSIMPVSFPPHVVTRSLLDGGTSAILEDPKTGLQESILDLVFFGAPELLHQHNVQNGQLVLVSELHASHLSLLSRQKLGSLLDPPESMGRDWCMLGVLLGMTDKLPKLDPGDNPALSPSTRILMEWIKAPDSTIASLLKKIEELGRSDAVHTALSTAPLFKLFPIEQSAQEDVGGGRSDSHTSTSNISR